MGNSSVFQFFLPQCIPYRKAFEENQTSIFKSTAVLRDPFSKETLKFRFWCHSVANLCPTLCNPMDCPIPSPGDCSNSCPLSRWCHPTISSFVIPFSSSLQSFRLVHVLFQKYFLHKLYWEMLVWVLGQEVKYIILSLYMTKVTVNTLFCSDCHHYFSCILISSEYQAKLHIYQVKKATLLQFHVRFRLAIMENIITVEQTE